MLQVSADYGPVVAVFVLGTPGLGFAGQSVGQRNR